MKTPNSYFVDSSNISSSGHIIIIMSPPYVPSPNSGLQLWIDGKALNPSVTRGGLDAMPDEIVLKELSLIVDNIYIHNLIYEQVLPDFSHSGLFGPVTALEYFGMVGNKVTNISPNVGLYFRGPSKEFLPSILDKKLLELGVIYLQNMDIAGAANDTYIYITPDKHDSQPFSTVFMNMNVIPTRYYDQCEDCSAYEGAAIEGCDTCNITIPHKGRYYRRASSDTTAVLYKITGLVAKDGVVNWDVYELKQLLTGSKYK